MKFSPILSLFSLLLCPSLVVLALPQGPQDVQVHAPEFKGDKDWPPEAPPPFNDIYFSWCRDYNVSSTCFGRGLKHGFCYDLPRLDGAIRDQLEDVGASGGQCMLFSKYNCKGDRTGMFVGDHLWTKFLCPKSRVKWHSSARSVRCCAGTPRAPWCNSVIRKPQLCSE